MIGLWSARAPIAEGFVDRELTRRGVPARYRIADIGFNRQRLTDVVIGDPADPDLVARRIDVMVALDLAGPKLVGIAADGVRLRGRWSNGRLSLGAIDRLLPPPSGKPFTLPDLDARLSDVRVRLDTPAGRIGLKIDGEGGLTHGFQGHVAAVSRQITGAGCTLAGPSAYLRVTIARREPRLRGTGGGAAADCSGVTAGSWRVMTDLTLDEPLDRWRGGAEARVSSLQWRTHRFADLRGQVRANGGVERTAGELRLSAGRFAMAEVQGQGLTVEGAFAAGASGNRFQGTAGVASARLPDRAARGLVAAGRATAGTPIGPIIARLGPALSRAGEQVSGRAAVIVEQQGDRGWLAVSGVDARSVNGARLLAAGGDGVLYRWPDGGFQADSMVSLTGGGLPAVSARLRGDEASGRIVGSALIGPMTADNASLTLSGVDFTVSPRSIRFATRATLSGPLGNGRIDALTTPLVGQWEKASGMLRINPGCETVRFRRLAVSGLSLDPAMLRLCAIGPALVTVSPSGTAGGARLSAPRLSGRVGDTPLTLAARGAEVTMGRSRFAVDGLEARLGEADRPTRLGFARLEGQFAGSDLAGRFSGGAGQIGQVPLLLSDAAGSWSLRNGALSASGTVGIADTDANPRFTPLVAPDMRLSLARNAIEATGTLTHAERSRAVGDVAIRHDLAAGTGAADLKVQDLRFDAGFQPEALTRLTVGVVANVRGTVTGDARIDWSGEGVRSVGAFRTVNTDLAAAFGPVTGLSTEVRFTDLLGTVSAPGQVATVRELNPGVAVTDGTIRYQLLADQRVAVEGGRWPFAGGELTLEPTILDFGKEVERKLTFQVVGLDAAQFIQQLEFENIAATGTFDGALPIAFDGSGGRIEGGSLVVRPGGGTLAYVGEVSNADLGTWGKLAFDALKSIRYDRLTIDLNGALDGEIVSQIRFNGVNQGTLEGGQAGFFREFIGLPFLFNITVRAPFRGLVSTARSFTDPSELIRSQLPELDSSPGSTVQPQESENRP